MKKTTQENRYSGNRVELSYYENLRSEQKASGNYVNLDRERLKDDRELKELESQIGFNNGRGGTYDPHNPDTTSRYHLFRARNGQVSDITDPDQAQELMDAGIVTPIL